MMRNDKDPTLGRMTEVDWDDPRVSRLLESTDTLRVDNRGTARAQAVHLRLGPAGTGAEGRGLLVGESDGHVLRLLFDQAVPAGRLVSIQRDSRGPMGVTWHTCSVISCRAGERREDTGRTLYVIELQAQRTQAPFSGRAPA